MPMFKNPFRKTPEPKLTTGETIQNLRATEEVLVKKQEFLESKIQIENDIAKKNATINKRIALHALKRKNRYQKQLQHIDGTLCTIEMQREALEGAHTNTAVLRSMTEAAKALKAAHQHLDADKVHDIMDDIADQQEISREISEAISNPVPFGQEVDEEDLEQELVELEQMRLEEVLLTVVPATPKAAEGPHVPQTSGTENSGKPDNQHQRDEHEDELKELADWAS